METSEETLKAEPTLADVMQELIKINKRLDGHDVQFEAIRQGIFDNSIRFERVEAEIYKMRGDLKNLKADVTELSESVRRKELV